MTEPPGNQAARERTAERSPNPRKILLLIGLGLFPGLSGVILSAALIVHCRQGWGEPGLFPGILYLLTVATALPGLASLMIAGFILLVTGGEAQRDPGELLGESRPAGFRRELTPGVARRKDLRQLWSPFLIYLACHTTARVIWHYWNNIFGVPLLLPEWSFSLLDGLHMGSIIFFLYFWLAGLVRINRAGLQISDLYKFWLFLALTLFLIPFLFFSDRGLLV